MGLKSSKKESVAATRASIEKELAKPRMSRSARITQQKLDTSRIPEQPSTTMTGIVDKIIPSPRPNKPEKAEISVEKAGRARCDLRIVNILTDENGDEVKLKKGVHVAVTVTIDPQTDNRK